MKKVLLVMGYKMINYGSAIQAVATQHLFEKVGFQVKVANMDRLWKEIKKRKILFYISNFQLTYIIQSKGKMLISKAIRVINKEYGEEFCKRISIFNDYLDSNLNLTRVINDFEDAANISEEYDYVILGSDQVWLPSSVVTDIYTLSFAWNKKNVRTISYAPSFGVDYILPRYKKAFKRMLDNFDYVSVREKAGLRIIRELSKKEISMVADPVLMLDVEEWKQIVPEEKVLEKNYVFIYFIGNNILHRRKVIQYAKEKQLNTVALIHLDEYVKGDEGVYDKSYISLTPEQFVNYIRNAEVVFTDSYHCLLLSLIHQKKVGTFLRFSNNSKVSTNNRIYSIMDRLGIESGIVDAKDIVDDKKIICNYESINQNIEEYRRQSYQFINNAIQ